MSAYCCPACVSAWLSAARFSSTRNWVAFHSSKTAWNELAACPDHDPCKLTSWADNPLTSPWILLIDPRTAAVAPSTASLSTWYRVMMFPLPARAGCLSLSTTLEAWHPLFSRFRRVGGGGGRVVLGEEGKGDAEGHTTAGSLKHLDGALVLRDDRGDDGEAQAASASLPRARRVGTPEPLEDLLTNLRRYALAVVDDVEHRHPAQRIDPDAQLDGAARWGEPHGVAHQVGDHLTELILLAENHRRDDQLDRFRVDDQGASICFLPGAKRTKARQLGSRECDRACRSGQGSVGGFRFRVEVVGFRQLVLGDNHADGAVRLRGHGVEGGILGDWEEVDRGEAQGLGLIRPGQFEQVFDQFAHPDRLFLDAFHRLRHVFFVLQCTHSVELGVAAHRHEGRPQFVAGVTDEVAHLVDGPGAVGEGTVDAPQHGVQ